MDIKSTEYGWLRKEYYKYRDNIIEFDVEKKKLFESLETLWMIKEELTQSWFFRYREVFEHSAKGKELFLLVDSDRKSHKWCNLQITRFHNDDLSENVINLFKKIPNWKWEIIDPRQYKNDQIWETHFVELEQYEKDNETTQVDLKTHPKLAKWTARQREQKKSNSKLLTPYRIEKLNSLKTWEW